MSYVVINAITVPTGQGDELARRFAGRAGAVEHSDGFEQFDLLRPADGRDQWLVVTRWRDEAAFQAWRTSAAFGSAHGTDAAPTGGGHPGGAGGHPGGEGGHPAGGPPPLATTSEVWSYTVQQHTAKV